MHERHSDSYTKGHHQGPRLPAMRRRPPPHCSVFDCPGRGGARLLRTVPFSPSLLLADPGPTSLVSQSAYESLDFG